MSEGSTSPDPRCARDGAPTVASCERCLLPLCAACAVPAGGGTLCEPCWTSLVAPPRRPADRLRGIALAWAWLAVALSFVPYAAVSAVLLAAAAAALELRERRSLHPRTRRALNVALAALALRALFQLVLARLLDGLFRALHEGFHT
jgi:hypothetical protein